MSAKIQSTRETWGGKRTYIHTPVHTHTNEDYFAYFPIAHIPTTISVTLLLHKPTFMKYLCL